MKKFIFSILIFLIILFGLVGIIYLITPKYYNVLVIGSDQREGLKEGDVKVTRGRSDVLMVVSIPKTNKKNVSILMIPRDTLVKDKEYGNQKICHYYAMGERYESKIMGNLPLTKEKVENLLGIKMDATFEVTFDGFADVIDLLGGVDTTEGHINTEEAIELIHNRYSQPNGDFGRAEEQRKIMRAILSKMKQPAYANLIFNYLRGSEDARLVYNKVKAVLFGLSYLLGHQGKLDINNMDEIELPGEGTLVDGLYYWQVDSDGMKKMVDQYMK